MNELGVAYSYAKFIESFGRANADVIPELLGRDVSPAQSETISLQKETIFRDILRQKGVQPLPGVVDWLERFRAAGWRQVVSSSGPMANIAVTIDVLRIGDFFASLMSGARLPQGKPHPAIFLRSAAAVAVSPVDCLVIEDSLAGIEAGLRAGMTSVAVGKISEMAALQRLVGSFSGDGAPPVCLPVPNLTQLTWEQLM
jgi:HAD superfamily hydrolase (TIGR01509 family)